MHPLGLPKRYVILRYKCNVSLSLSLSLSTHTYIYIHIHIYIYTYTHIYIYIYICIFLSRCPTQLNYTLFSVPRNALNTLLVHFKQIHVKNTRFWVFVSVRSIALRLRFSSPPPLSQALWAPHAWVPGALLLCLGTVAPRGFDGLSCVRYPFLYKSDGLPPFYGIFCKALDTEICIFFYSNIWTSCEHNMQGELKNHMQQICPKCLGQGPQECPKHM